MNRMTRAVLTVATAASAVAFALPATSAGAGAGEYRWQRSTEVARAWGTFQVIRRGGYKPANKTWMRGFLSDRDKETHWQTGTCAFIWVETHYVADAAGDWHKKGYKACNTPTEPYKYTEIRQKAFNVDAVRIRVCKVAAMAGSAPYGCDNWGYLFNDLDS